MVQAKECISNFQFSPLHNSNLKPQHHVHVDTPTHPEGKTMGGAAIEAVLHYFQTHYLYFVDYCHQT